MDNQQLSHLVINGKCPTTIERHIEIYESSRVGRNSEMGGILIGNAKDGDIVYSFMKVKVERKDRR